MANDPTKVIPKFESPGALEFWEKVYIASVETGQTGPTSAGAADKAVERRQERLSKELNEYEQEMIDVFGEV